MKEFVAQEKKKKIDYKKKDKNFNFLKEWMDNLSKVKGETNRIDFFHLSSTFTE